MEKLIISGVEQVGDDRHVIAAVTVMCLCYLFSAKTA